MLVNFKKKIVCYTPFKNYSTTLHTYMCKRKEWQHVLSTDGRELGQLGQHSPNIDPDWEGWQKWLPIRNPFARVKSAWKYTCKMEGWVPYAEWEHYHLTSPALRPVTLHFPDYTRLIPVERMPEILIELECNYGEFPHRNAGTHNHRLTEDQRERIRVLHYYDFQAGRYDMYPNSDRTQ